MINSARIMIPIEDFFNEEGNHITKKEYGQLVLKYLCEELKENHAKSRNIHKFNK